MTESRYPEYDVMDSKHEWDPHTQQVIDQRMQAPGSPRFFTNGEADLLRVALTHLLAEQDPTLIDKVLELIDSPLADDAGDGYRPESQLPDPELWRSGLAELEPGFLAASGEEQRQALVALQAANPTFFRTLLKEAVSAYCSLPPVWNFMGYGGPAYPRGYVRIELGLRDRWEAKQLGQ